MTRKGPGSPRGRQGASHGTASRAASRGRFSPGARQGAVGSRDTLGGRQGRMRTSVSEDDYELRRRAREVRHRQQAEERNKRQENPFPRERKEEPECRRCREEDGVGLHSLHSFPSLTRPGNGRRGAFPAPRSRAY